MKWWFFSVLLYVCVYVSKAEDVESSEATLSSYAGLALGCLHH